MRKRIVLSFSAMAFALAAGNAFAQAPAPENPKSAEPSKFYKLEFVVKEVEGAKTLNARAYSMVVIADGHDNASVRTGSKVPVGTTSKVPGAITQFQFYDVGVNIDVRKVQEMQRDLTLYVSADVSSLASEHEEGLPPTVRQNKWNSTVTVPVKRPTVIFSSDDPASKRQMQLEVVATPIQ